MSNEVLYPYDPSQIPGIFKLESFANLCYMNAIIQSLVSLSSVNGTLRHMYGLKEHGVVDESNERGLKERSNLVSEFVRFILCRNRTLPELPVSCAARIFNALNAYQRSRDLQILQPSRQEDAHEGLTLILDALGPSVSRHFEIRYASEIICCNIRCGHRTTPGGSNFTEPPELMIDLGRSDIEFSSQQEVQDYLRRHELYPRDYRCEKCGITNNTRPGPTPNSEVIVARNVMQRYSLRRVNEVIILYFKKYNVHPEDKKLQYFPPALSFTARQGVLHYEPVAQVDHYGTVHGGHYVARVRRPKPKGFQELWDSILQERVTNKQSREAQQLRAWRNAAHITHDVFLINDAKVDYAGCIKPTKETYMVFYHLTRIIPRSP